MKTSLPALFVLFFSCTNILPESKEMLSRKGMAMNYRTRWVVELQQIRSREKILFRSCILTVYMIIYIYLLLIAHPLTIFIALYRNPEPSSAFRIKLDRNLLGITSTLFLCCFLILLQLQLFWRQSKCVFPQAWQWRRGLEKLQNYNKYDLNTKIPFRNELTL